MKKKFSRTLSWMTAAVMAVSMLPMMSASAATTSFEKTQLSVVSQKTSTLAKGVTQDEYTVFDKNGKQVKLFAATIDPKVDTVKMFTSYKDMDNTSYGMSKLTEQVAAFDKKAATGDPYYQGTVVAGINASYYNMTTGKPSGVFVMNGNDVTGGERSAYFAILKDGTVKIGNKDEYEADKGNIQEALGIYTMLVYDGNIVLSEANQKDTKKYPRQTIGITADGKVILLSADGNQEPESAGLTLMEQAQAMLDLGCVYAGHLDGGGSMTYGSRPEGEDMFKIVNKPSDGSERSISNGFIVVSTEAASKAFDHVRYDVETEYATPGTPVSVSVIGVSSTGNAAEIPADITYEVENGTYENGVLTAGAAVGDVTLKAFYQGKPAGETTIHAVLPEELKFVSENMTVPFGKTISLKLTATYGINDVKVKAEDLEFTLENAAIGSIQGFDFTAGDGSVAESKITAMVKNTSVSAKATIKLGRGSVVLWDFEDGDGSEFSRTAASNYNYLLTPGTCNIVDETEGQVHSGQYALRFNADFSAAIESGYMNGRLQVKNKSGERIDLKDATRLGMWIYFPAESPSLNGRIFLQEVTARNEDGSIKSVNSSYTTANTIDNVGTWDCGFTLQYEEPGWHYVYFDLEGGDWCIPADWVMLDFYVNDRDGSKFGYNHFEYKSVNTNAIMYLDDVTVDYSSAVDDRDAPVFEKASWANRQMSDSVDFVKGETAETKDNVLSFSAFVKDFEKDNATGLNEKSAKIYVDGVRVKTSINNGTMSAEGCTLADGVHTVKFEICDIQGNRSSIIRKIDVQANSGLPTVQLVPHDKDLDNILLGSIYYIDLTATALDQVQSVTADIDLNNMSRWELEHMEAAPGFEASYEMANEDENIATITITRTDDVNAQNGDNTLVSIPVRTWELPAIQADGTRNNVWMYPEYKKGNEVWPIDIRANVVRGIVEFTDGTEDTFTGSGVQVDTEAHYWTNGTKPADYKSWNGGHDHRAETKQYYAESATNHVDAVALPDKAVTCTAAGYTGRTYCEVCHSVVEWGTTIPATGHKYEFVENVLKCTNCDELFTGTWTDGKQYVDGVATVFEDGWNRNSYYKDGKKLTGIQKLTAPDNSGEFYYDFGEDGVTSGKYNGLLQLEDQWYYSKLGVLTGGWQQVGENWHYFRSYTKSAVTGEYTVNGVTYQFDEKGMTKGAWHTDDKGTRYYYGPSYYLARNPGYMALQEIDGKTYNFGNDGYLTCGVQVLRDSTSFKKYVYVFGEDGALEKKITESGLYTAPDGMYYINQEGYILMDAGLIQIDGDYYYVVHSGKLKQGGSQTITSKKANGLPYVGTYYFGEDGKMELSEEPGTPTGIFQDGDHYVYKINGEIQKNAGLIQIDGAYYFVCYSGKLKQNGYQTITAANANGLYEPGVYYFGEDCKMVIPPKQDTTTGIVFDEANQRYVYKENGVIQKAKGLIKFEEDFYYVCYSGKLKQNGNQTITEKDANNLCEPGTYYFDKDCKMEDPSKQDAETGVFWSDENGYYVYKVGGKIQQNLGLIQVGDDYYYVCYSGKLKQNGNQTITEKDANGLCEPGTYYFDDNCIMEKR